jgi:RNA polymerase subunit RPABC4/transcription elongation factor Spt4
LEFESAIARGFQVLLALGGAYLLALWFVLIVWTFRDIETRSRSVVTQVFSTLLVVLFWVPGLMLYWMLRPKQTLDEAYQRSLEEEYLVQDIEEVPVCPSCQRFVEDDFRLCPHCQTELREDCVHCDRLIDLHWHICPYCGTDQDRQMAPASIEPAAERWVAIETPARTPALHAESSRPAIDVSRQSPETQETAPRLERLDRMRFARAIRPNGHQNGAEQDGATAPSAQPSTSDGDEPTQDGQPTSEPATVPERFKVESKS